MRNLAASEHRACTCRDAAARGRRKGSLILWRHVVLSCSLLCFNLPRALCPAPAARINLRRTMFILTIHLSMSACWVNGQIYCLTRWALLSRIRPSPPHQPWGRGKLSIPRPLTLGLPVCWGPGSPRRGCGNRRRGSSWVSALHPTFTTAPLSSRALTHRWRMALSTGQGSDLGGGWSSR